VSPDSWKTLIAAGALALGLVNLYFGILRPWWRGREAHPEARLESHSYVDFYTPDRTDQRLVLVNHGARGHARGKCPRDRPKGPIAPIEALCGLKLRRR